MNESTIEAVIRATKPVRYAAAAALSLLALFLLILSVHEIGNLGRYSTYTNTITVEGTGTGTAVPNVAMIDFSVTETAATVADAQQKATAKTDAALAAMKTLGIEDKDVKTISYNVNPQYEQTPCYNGICPTSAPKITGYQVMETVEVKIRDTAKAGDALQALGTLNVQNISGPNFTVDEDEAVHNVAREEAIDNAKAKAKALADRLGVRLGKVVSFYENTGPMYPMYDSYGYDGKAGMMEAQAAPSLPTGEQETNVSVSVTFEIH